MKRRNQSGVAVIAIVTVLLLVGAYVFIGSLNASSIRVDRDRATRETLLKAREALIAYAAADANRPGELPCPDVNDDGKLVLGEDFIGSNCVSLIGRLPFITLDLPDLRDDTGERLWYALSDDFHANGSVALNSDTAYRVGNTSLTINGLQPAGNVVAIVFSPGAVLQREGAAAVQQRSCSGGSCDMSGKCTSAPASNTPKCNAANYLDVVAGVDNADGDTVFVSAAKIDSFNDRLMPIHSDDIMWLVERRAGREFAQKLREHYDAWQSAVGDGFYPWAAPFTDPANAQAGQNNRQEGLLPVSPASVVWTSGSVTSGSCAGVGTNELVCTALVLLGVGGDVSGRVGNIATSFIDPPDGSEVTTSGLLLLGSPSTTWTLNKTAQALDFSTDVTFLGTGVVTVRVLAPSPSPWLASSWLMTNRWYENAYYAVAPPYAVDGDEICGSCITVANTAAPANKQAIVVMTGRALPLAAPAQNLRPVAPPAAEDQFLEGANRTTADRIFEHNLKSATFNDLPIAVRP
jgi:hypothetical protein